MADLDADAIRELRRRLGISQEELARAIGVSFATVNRWENGHTRPSRAAERLLRDFLERNTIELSAETEGTSSAGPTKTRILIVDDDRAVLRSLRRTFEHFADRFEVETAADGYEAGIKTGVFKPDVVILDIYLPRIDGFEVCRYLKSRRGTSEVHVIAVTGYGTEETLQRIRQAGADAILLKPIDVNELLITIDRIIGEPVESGSLGSLHSQLEQ